jgi:HPt (histidine-containing phosphotransfer) domain-containing protein
VAIAIFASYVSESPAPKGVTPVHNESAVDSTVFDDFRSAGAGANDFVINLIDQYLEEAAGRMTALKEAVERGDAPALKLASHALKGTSGSVGAHRLAAICGALETLARDAIFDGTPAVVIELEDEFQRVRAALLVEQGNAA